MKVLFVVVLLCLSYAGGVWLGHYAWSGSSNLNLASVQQTADASQHHSH